MGGEPEIRLDVTPPVEKLKSFSTTVEIGGQTYTFLGRFSDVEKRVRLELRCQLTDDEKKAMTAHKVNREYVRDGVVGVISARADTYGADIGLTGIISLSDKVPKESPRYRAPLGSFLLRNFLTLTDIKGWSVSATLSPEGRLKMRDMEGWFKNQGFEGPDAHLKHIRKKGVPDKSQLIAQFT